MGGPQTYRIALDGVDEERASYLEALAAYEPTEVDILMGIRALTDEEKADLRQRATAIRDAAEHRGDWVEIPLERTFGTLVDTQEHILQRNIGAAKVALLHSCILGFQIEGKTGARMTTDDVRALSGDVGDWLYERINEHYESIRRRDPKVTARSISTS